MYRIVLSPFKQVDEDCHARRSPNKVDISVFSLCTRLRRDQTDRVSLVLKRYDVFEVVEKTENNL